MVNLRLNKGSGRFFEFSRFSSGKINIFIFLAVNADPIGVL